jgi:hypothetical protein
MLEETPKYESEIVASRRVIKLVIAKYGAPNESMMSTPELLWMKSGTSNVDIVRAEVPGTVLNTSHMKFYNRAREFYYAIR